MVRTLGIGGDPAQHVTRVVGGGENHILKRHAVHVMRAAERRQCAAGLSSLSARRWDFLVARSASGTDARLRVNDGGSRMMRSNLERLLVRFDGRLRLEPVENVHASMNIFPPGRWSAALRVAAAMASALWSSRWTCRPRPRAPRANQIRREN